MAISGRSVISVSDFEVDPRLVLPNGIKNVGYTEAIEEEPVEFVSSDDVVSGTQVVTLDPEGNISSPGVPVPDSVVVVNQTVRIVPGGGIVVDVELEVTNSANNDTFELRIAKIDN